MRRGLFVLAALAVAVALRPALAESQKSPKPALVISFAGYNETMKDLRLLGDIVGHADLDKNIEGALALVTHGQGLAGLDKGKPWGAAMFIDGDKPTGYGFIPVTDLKKLLTLAEAVGHKAKDAGDGLLEIDTKHENRRLFIREKDGWAFVADKPENLADLPADPAALITGLPEKYDWAVRLNVCNVPAERREKLIERLERHVKKHLERIKGSEEEIALHKMIAKQVVAGIDDVTGQIDQITLGWAIDRETHTARLDACLTALKGTDAAKHLAELGKAKTRFAGFHLPDAAVTGGFAYQCEHVDAEDVASLLKAARAAVVERIAAKVKSDEKAQEAKKFAGKLLDVAGKTIASGRLDGAMSLVLRPDAATLVAGRFCADPDNLEETLGALVKVARTQHPEVDKMLKTNADELKGVRLHVLTIPIPDKCPDREKAVALVGENLEIAAGFGDNRICLAAGKDALKTLKTAIEQSDAKGEQAAAPAKFSASLARIAEFAAVVAKPEDQEKAKKVAALLKQAGDKDHVRTSVAPIERGVQFRLELEEGVLKLIAEAHKLQ